MEITLVPFCSFTASIEISNASLVGSSGRTHRPSFLLDGGATPAAETLRRLAGPVLTLAAEESYVSSVGTCVGGIASSWAECERVEMTLRRSCGRNGAHVTNIQASTAVTVDRAPDIGWIHCGKRLGQGKRVCLSNICLMSAH
jgi:hypothetical protein